MADMECDTLIISDSCTNGQWEKCKNKGLFGKRCGFGSATNNIIQWIKASFGSQDIVGIVNHRSDQAPCSHACAVSLISRNVENYAPSRLGSNDNLKISEANNNDKNEKPTEDYDRIEEENRIILEYVGNEVANDLMEQFINEIADEEELALQKRLTIVNILEFISSEVNEVEDMMAKLRKINSIPQDEILGIAETMKNPISPDCAKVLRKKGRKSLFKLRTKVGEAAGQVKLTALFNVGKGKVLPEVPRGS
ncbi:hypothetical protein SUGI_0198340 [Cryptomeria japonica]|nr:hypothetical protein SUGI_0198340 [Cryptomeria japonica]